MKIIHCGDLHLDSKMDSVLPKEKAKERKNEILMTFLKMVEYARKNWVSVIIIAGDMFDTTNVSAKARNIVLDAICSNPGIDFLYLRGNHDSDNFLSNATEIPSNLKLFDNNWLKYEYEDVAICGVELDENNYTSIYDDLILDSHRMNIVVLHGQESVSSPKDKAYVVNVKALRDKNIDYLALGHIHSHKLAALDTRGVYGYSGCLEGRGFDECGEKGFVLLDIEHKRLTTTFVPIANRCMRNITVDVTGSMTSADIIKKISAAVMGISSKDLIKIVLIGQVDISAERDIRYIEQTFEQDFYFVKIYDKTKLLLNIDDFMYDPTVRGEFVKLVLKSSLSGDEKEQIILKGIRALSGEELD